MNLGFSISNLTIIAMILFIGFCSKENEAHYQNKYNWKELAAVYNEDHKACVAKLQVAGFIEKNSGYENLKIKIPDFDAIKFQYKFNNLKQSFVNKIEGIYETFDKKESHAIAYYFSLVINDLKKSNLLPITTWCRIHGNGTYMSDIMKENTTIYSKYLKNIAINTGLMKKEQALVYRTIDVCLYEITDMSEHSYFYKLYNSISYDNEYEYFKIEPFSFCLINGCSESLRIAGFSDESVEENIKIAKLLIFKIEDTNGYTYKYFQYLKNIDDQSNHSQILNSYDREDEIKYGSLKNWCTVQVCNDSLVDAGFIYEHFANNYTHVLPSTNKLISQIVKDRNISFEFVAGYSSFLNFIYNNYVNNSQTRNKNFLTKLGTVLSQRQNPNYKNFLTKYNKILDEFENEMFPEDKKNFENEMSPEDKKNYKDHLKILRTYISAKNPMFKYVIEKLKDELSDEDFAKVLNQMSVRDLQKYKADLKKYNTVTEVRTPLDWCKLIITPYKKTSQDTSRKYNHFGIKINNN